MSPELRELLLVTLALVVGFVAGWSYRWAGR